MTMRGFLVAIFIGLLPLSKATADATSHRQAAEAFFSVAMVDDPKKLATVVAEMISQLQPDLRRHQEILNEFAREIVTSKKYREARIKIYQDLLAEDELRALTELFQDPVYRKYLEVRVQIVRRSAEETVALFQDALPELVRRINENTESADPADR